MRRRMIDQSQSPSTMSEVHRGCHGSHAVVTMPRQTTMQMRVPYEDACLAGRSATGPVASSNIVLGRVGAQKLIRSEHLVRE